MNNLLNSIQKLIGSSVKLGLVQAGIPYILNKVEETKYQTERKFRVLTKKVIIGVVTLIFFLIFTAFLFTGIFFFLTGNGTNGIAAIITSLIALFLTLIIGATSFLVSD